MKPKILALMVMGVFVLTPLFGVGWADKMYHIGEIVIIQHPDLQSDSDGFKKAMEEEGLVEGKNVKYLRLNAEGDMSVAATIAQRFVSEKVDLMHPISTPVSQACVAAGRGTQIPIVFSTCTAPAKAEIVSSWEAPRPDNVTGVSDMADIKVQMVTIKKIFPDLKTLGVIYNAGEVNSVQQIDELKGILSDVGIGKLVEATCSTTAEVITATRSLIGRVDAIWNPTDNTTTSGLEAVIRVCEENTIPLFGSTGAMVERGCIAARGANYSWIGWQAGKYAAAILKGEKKASDIPVVKCSGDAQVLVVNPAAAKRMGITIPESVIASAARVIQ
ncbi:MAG: ABC transporter substrate-binding protein [Deltaproteobacteria bacterium]|nr:MAG: ABC transporter substrate-binding protein [Deltaproteobacteria bacterium]UCH08418.1 MAG: ABC transporter substrate-binding protein [Deltaproteobacteria bacterium]